MPYETNAERLMDITDRKARLRYLRFDRANYGRLNVPCQVLAATFYVSGLNYHIVTEGGVEAPVNKKAVMGLMEQGALVCVADPKAKMVHGTLQTSICLWIGRDLSLYDRVSRFNYPLDDDKLHYLTGQSFNRPEIGKKLIYRFDEKRGVGSNLFRSNPATEDRADD